MQQRGPINFTEFFKTEKDVWVKAIVPGQVSFAIKDSHGHYSPITVPYTGDPIPLTDKAPFDAIKGSQDLRTLCSPRKIRDGQLKPPALQLMTAEEAEAHFAEKAKRKGLWQKDFDGQPVRDDNGQLVPDVIAAMETSVPSGQQQPRVTLTPGPDDNVDDNDEIPKAVVNMQFRSDVQPRVLHLCNQVSPSLADNDRWSADSLKTELEAMESTLTQRDLEHISTNGFYTSIKTWATTRFAQG